MFDVKAAVSRRCRSAAAVIAVVCCSLVSLPAIAQSKPLQGQTVVVYTFGGTYLEQIRELVIKPFEAETGAKVIVDDSCCTRWQAAAEGGQFIADAAIGISRNRLLALAQKGYLLSDPRLEKMARGRGVPDRLVSPNMVMFHSDSYVIAAKDHSVPLPKTWAEFWDTKKFPGSRGLFRAAPAVQLEAALLADGVAPNKLYPLDTERAYKKLDELRASAKIIVNASGADMINNLGTGETTYAIVYGNRVFRAQKDGIKINYTFDDAFAVSDGGAILKGAKNVNGAIAFLEYHLRPDVLARLAAQIGEGPSYRAAFDMVDEKVKSMIPTAPANAAKQHVLDDEYWQANQIEQNKRWINWLAK